MAITTQVGHIQQAINFINNHSHLYFEFAKEADWPDSNNPEAENETTTSLTDPKAYLKVDHLYLCYDTNTASTSSTDTDTTITYKSKAWSIVDPTTVLPSTGIPTQDARYVCLVGTLAVSELDTFKYTQIGVVDFPTDLASHALLANAVSSTGSLLFYENRMLETYTNTNSKVVKYMLKF